MRNLYDLFSRRILRAARRARAGILTACALTAGFSANAQYCATTGTTNCTYESITNVTFAGINNTTTCSSGAYGDYTSGTAASVTAGSSYTLSVSINPDIYEYVAVWFDWDHDMSFETGEKYLLVSSTSSAGPFTTSVAVPFTAYVGTTTMRVRLAYNYDPDACTSSSIYGETEDYAVTIAPPPLTPVISAAVNPLLCNGDSTDIYVAIAGGVSPYSIAWNTGQTMTGANDTLSATAGTYSVTVTDDNGSTETALITITEPSAIISSINITQDLTCHYDLGAGYVTASGGTPSSTAYIVDTTNFYDPDSSSAGTTVALGDDQVSAALPIGFSFTFFGNTYTDFYIASNGFVSFTDYGSGCCTGQLLPSATTPNNLIALAWEDLNPGSGGTINYYTTGTSPNQVLIVNFIGVPHYGSSATITIQLKLFESTNCIEIHTTNMTPDASTGQTQGIENAPGTIAYWYPGRNSDDTWVGDHDMISFCPDPFSSYLWSTGTTIPAVTNLVAGMNYVSITDGNGCVHVDSVELVPISHLVSNTTKTDISCYSANDGTIDPVISGGVLPYVYSWNNSQTTATLSNLGPGIYHGMVEDNVNCTLDIDTVTIIEPDLLISSVTSITNVVCANDSNGAGTIVTQGGVPPYAYNWMPGGYTASSVIGLTSGVYNVQVMDANGCASYNSVSILALNPVPVVDLGADILNTGGDTITLAPLSGSYSSYNWNTSASTASIDVTQTGTYWLEVTNDAGCVGADTIYVEVWPTGVEEHGATAIKLYPNPASSDLMIEVPQEMSDFELTILDIRGSVIFRQQYVQGGNQRIDVSQWAAGVYTVSVSRDNQQLLKTRLVKAN